MRILVVPNTDWVSAPRAGRMNFLFDRIAGHHEVDVAYFRYDMFRDEDELRTACRLISFGTFKSSNLAIEYVLHAPSHFFRFARLLRQREYDVMVLGNLLPAFIVTAIRGNTPVVLDLFDRFDQSAQMHYVDRPLTSAVVGQVGRKLLQGILKTVDCVVTVAQDDVAYVREIAGPRVALYTIPNGIELDKFRPTDKDESKTLVGLSGATVVGFTGLLEKWIDLETVVDLMPEVRAKLGDVRLLVVGRSYYCTYDDELRRKVDDLGLTEAVLLTGMVPYEDMQLYVGAMDVCLNPRRPLEMNTGAISNKLLGYLACGRPVLSTNNPAAERQFRHVYSYARSTFVDALGSLLQDLPTTETVRAEALGYDWDDLALQFERLLEDTARTAPRRQCHG